MSLTDEKMDNLHEQEVKSVVIKPKNKMFKYLFKYIGICHESEKQITILFLVCHAELSGVRYKTGARPWWQFHLSRTQMSALTVRLGSWGNSNKPKYANVYFPWLGKWLWTIAPATWLLILAMFACLKSSSLWEMGFAVVHSIQNHGDVVFWVSSCPVPVMVVVFAFFSLLIT